MWNKNQGLCERENPIKHCIFKKHSYLYFFRNAKIQMKTKACLQYFVNDCLWKKFFASNLPQTIFATLRSLTKF